MTSFVFCCYNDQEVDLFTKFCFILASLSGDVLVDFFEQQKSKVRYAQLLSDSVLCLINLNLNVFNHIDQVIVIARGLFRSLRSTRNFDIVRDDDRKVHLS